MAKPKPAEPREVYSAQISKQVKDDFKARYGTKHTERLEYLLRADLADSDATQFEQEAQEKEALAVESEQQAKALQEAAASQRAQAASLKAVALDVKERKAKVLEFIGPKLKEAETEAIQAIKTHVLSEDYIKAKDVAKHRSTGLMMNFAVDISAQELLDKAIALAGAEKLQKDKMFG
jgi:hypothetical protein